MPSIAGRTTILAAAVMSAACRNADEVGARSTLLQSEGFIAPISYDLPSDLTPAYEKWYRDGWNGWMPRIRPNEGNMSSIPEGVRTLLSGLQAIRSIELPSIDGHKLQYFRYTTSLKPLLLDQDNNRRRLTVAHRDLSSVSSSKCYDADPVEMGRRKVCSLVFAYRLISDIPSLAGDLSKGNGHAELVRNLDTGRWEITEFKLTEPSADELATLAAKKRLHVAGGTPAQTPSDVATTSAGQAVGAAAFAAATPQHPADSSFLHVLRSDILKLKDAQAGFFASHSGRFASTLSELADAFRPSPGVTIVIWKSQRENEWSVEAHRTRATRELDPNPETCTLITTYVGIPPHPNPSPPQWEEPWCRTGWGSER